MKSEKLDDYCGIKIRKGQLGEQDKTVVREVVVADGYRLDARHLMPKRKSFVVDVGSHIGTFARMWHLRNPAARIVCVEVCPENWEVLDVNTSLIASVERAACTYEKDAVILHNSVMDGGTATGGSIVTNGEASQCADIYWVDERPVQKVTLESLLAKYHSDRIDCLKLDCEGSEFSILEHATCLDRVGFICGEQHDIARWDALVARKFQGWSYAQWNNIFHLQHPQWNERFKPANE